MRVRSNRPPLRQRGLAIITAVLVVAIIATVAASLGLGQQVWLRQTENLVDRAQSDALRQGALDWVALWLARDATQNKTDHLGEIWAKNLPPLPAENAMITVAVTDAQGRFNLNSLLRHGAPSAPDIGVFRRLLSALDLDPNLTEALLDWMDADNDTRPGGAEDIEYLALPQPYRAANQALASLEELRLVKGFSAQAIEKLRPYVSVLPEPTAINVNTAPGAVLAALFTDVPVEMLQPILDSRVSQPFADVGQFLQRLPAGHASSEASISVSTGYFLVAIEIQSGRLTRRTEALIQRPANQPATVLWQQRQYRQPEPATEEHV
ncbi:MAG: type II secretion system minor pseudopilin GspK [Burkholderiales bacterium]